jgi:hypothetical protein
LKSADCAAAGSLRPATPVAATIAAAVIIQTAVRQCLGQTIIAFAYAVIRRSNLLCHGGVVPESS